ncbi:MAG: hypothetical protein JXR96_12990 [Deltaproteobacteria bacterium]|nr:hypothetical protein [Deltaproteobacteria bacterium]
MTHTGSERARSPARWAFPVTAGAVIAGGVLLLLAYGFDLTCPLALWRDHPFDLANIRHLQATADLSSRLWAYDPYHLFGWTPHVFTNPLASLGGALATAPWGGSEGAYTGWLVALLLTSAVCFWVWLPRDARPIARIAGGVLAGLLSLLVYPMDVGILDANPVQVLYTGQWAQRIGLALALLCLERLYRALDAVHEAPRLATRRALAASALFGAALFTHFMSGVAVALGACWLTLHAILARKNPRQGWRGAVLLAGLLIGSALLYLDFLLVFLRVHDSHHSLPILAWHMPEAARASMLEVLLAGLPVLLLPGVRMLVDPDSRHSRPAQLEAGLPLLVLAGLTCAGAGPGLLATALLVGGCALIASRLRGRADARHVLPALGMLLCVFACGPDSLRPFGLDLSALVPFSASLGWAKLAAAARFVLLAWLGLLAVDALDLVIGLKRRRLGLGLTTAGILLGLGLPLALSLGSASRTGAESFFGWMAATDLHATGSLMGRMSDAGLRTPPDGLLLAEDCLHHPEGSALAGRGLPHGHLAYLVGPQIGRPVLGGCVTTRYLTHPLAQTARGQLLCQWPSASSPDRLLQTLASHGIAEVLVHSQGWIRALQRSPRAERLDEAAGLVRFRLRDHASLVTEPGGQPVSGATIAWTPAGPDLELPAGVREVHLRLVHLPFLECAARDQDGNELPCALSRWRDEALDLRGCSLDDPKLSIRVDVPWIKTTIGRSDSSSRPVHVQIRSRPSVIPFAIMILAWIAAAVIRLTLLRRAS